MPETNAVERARKKQQERSILFTAGILGHWVTDTSQPMHTSVHVHGWNPDVANPNGNVGKDLHRRYETDYVGRAIRLEEVAALTDNKVRKTGDWLQEAETYIGKNNVHVEQIYVWDKQSPFGGGNEPQEAQAFTAARLADGARMLRDVWYTAWIRSGEPVPRPSASR